MTVSVAAIDLGATSGRVMVGAVGPETLEVRQVNRFPNGPVRLSDGLHWDFQALYRSALDGLRSACRWDPEVRSLGIDSWAVDYGLLRAGRMLGEPYHYRDDRTEKGVQRVHKNVTRPELFARNGLQFLPFNTIYQLAAEDPAVLAAADTMLLVPDLLAFQLSGVVGTERTNASTTGLIDVATGSWDIDLMGLVGLDPSLFSALVDPGTILGQTTADIRSATGLSVVEVVTVGSHDTASAVVGTPLPETGGAFISCGTWGLVGMETERPVLSEAAREANFTNEGGVDGRTRFLHNVMGLWLLNESVSHWERQDGQRLDLDRLLAEAGAVGEDVAVFDANDPAFLAPGDMPRRIQKWCRSAGLPEPKSRPEITRSIIESLAVAFAAAATQAGELAGVPVTSIHLTGGGSQNELLCRRIADLSGLPVEAGPVEATAIGNVLVQGRALGAVSGSLESLRALVARKFEPRVFAPSGGVR